MILRELLIRLGFDFDKKGADSAHREISGLRRAGETLIKAFAFQKVFQGLTGMLDQASAASDRLNVLKKTFGAQGDEVVAWTELAAEGLGRSKYSLQEYASSFGSLLVPAMKGNTKVAAEMSTSLAGLAVDLGSFFHIADDEALWRLRSGLLGSTIAVDNLGIELHDAALKVFAQTAEAKAKGLKYDKDPQHKMQLRFAKMMHDAANAQGWAAHTAKEYDNQLRKFKETIKTLTTDIGMGLLPIGTAIVMKFSEWADKLLVLVKHSNAVTVALGMLGAFMGLLAVQWTLANLPLLVTIAVLGLLYLAIEDLYTGLEGGDSIIKDWFENLMGKDKWEDVIRTWKAGKEILDAVMSGDWDAVSNKIFDFANPNSTSNDRNRMALNAYGVAAREAGGRNASGGAVSATTQARAMAALSRGDWQNVDSGHQITGGQRRGVGPIAGGGGYNAGNIQIIINGHATPATASEIARHVQRVQEQQQRDLYKTTGKFNVAAAGSGGVAGAEGPLL
jgi:hypothetical protein